jgi:hypothetical protein
MLDVYAVRSVVWCGVVWCGVWIELLLNAKRLAGDVIRRHLYRRTSREQVLNSLLLCTAHIATTSTASPGSMLTSARPVIRTSRMPPEMQEAAVQVAQDAIRDHITEQVSGIMVLSRQCCCCILWELTLLVVRSKSRRQSKHNSRSNFQQCKYRWCPLALQATLTVEAK